MRFLLLVMLAIAVAGCGSGGGGSHRAPHGTNDAPPPGELHVSVERVPDFGGNVRYAPSVSLRANRTTPPPTDHIWIPNGTSLRMTAFLETLDPYTFDHWEGLPTVPGDPTAVEVHADGAAEVHCTVVFTPVSHG